jgi:hypothetical protein
MRHMVAKLAAGLVALSMGLSMAMFIAPSAVPAPGCPSGTTSQPWQTGCY